MYTDIEVTKNEVRIPGYLQDGAQFTSAWLAGKPAGSESLAIWGCWDDPALGGISTLKQQERDDVLVYGTNGNVDATAATTALTIRLVVAIQAPMKRGLKQTGGVEVNNQHGG